MPVAAGETLGIVGPNGSGKSTLLNAIFGLVPATGRLAIAGGEVALGHPQRIRRAGVLRAFQTPQCFDDLTVLANALLALPDRRHSGLVGACLLLLDEPSLGLAPAIIKNVYDVRRDISATVPLLLVEQSTTDALALADHAYILANGMVVVDAPAEELRNQPLLLDSYLR